MAFLGLRDDFREGLRRVRRNPRSSLVAMGTLALGIGAATAVFTIAHTLLIAPPPFRDPGRLVEIHGFRDARRWQGVSGADFLDYRKEGGLLESSVLTDYAEFSWTDQSLPGFDGAEVLRGQSVTADYFRVFDHPMAAGRGFAPEEDQPGSNPVAVISYSLWQRRFGGRPEIVGETMTLNGRVHTVIGVAGPRMVADARYEVAIWAPLSASAGTRNSRQYSCYARLAQGINVGQAQQRLTTLNARLAEAYPDSNKDYAVTVQPLAEELRAKVRPALQVLLAAVVCLLLIAAANAASLLLARATSQTREMAIRAALGAGRFRLYRMMLAESLVLALMACAGGALLSVWLLTAAKALVGGSGPFDWVFAVDSRVFVAAFLLSALAGLVAGLAPAFESFRAAAGGMRPSFGRNRLLRGIVTTEIALATLLSVGAGLLGKSYAGLVNRPLGYQTDQLLGMRIRLTGERYRGYEKKAEYWSQLIERAGALPGIAKSAAVSDLPMGQQYSGGGFEFAGHTVAPGGEPPQAHQIVASPGYFATAGIPLVAGRGFSDHDGPQSEPVAIVNDLLAETFWPGQNPVGQRVKSFDETWRRVIGVVRRIRHTGPEDDYENEIYMPYRQINFSTMFLVVRTHVPPETVVASIRATLRSLDRNVPAFEIRSMEERLDRQVTGLRLPMVLTTGFASLAALLAGLGLFGVMAYWVSQRTRELGIRAALGAGRGGLHALVVRQGGQLALIGIVLGLAASVGLARFLRSLLYGMSERDLSVYIGVVLILVSLCCAAQTLELPTAKRVRPAPEQPIPFSHKRHAGVGLECKECHQVAEPGNSAGLPPTSKCMSCHSEVSRDAAAIAKLAAYHKDGKRVPWEPVYRIPGYVFFSHKQHLATGKVTCGSCHGPVGERDTLRREKDISMAACMDCHRAGGASLDCDYCHETR